MQLLLAILLTTLSCCIIASKVDFDFGPSSPQLFAPPPPSDASSEFTQLYARDVEPIPGPLSYGHKYMTGGAGEGAQQLHADKSIKHREQVKSDSILPAYCEPPNPCPIGYHGETDGCMDEFENSADFSRTYQSNQKCMCDEEHMFNCPDKLTDDDDAGNDFGAAMDELMNNGLHKSMMAKKFHEKRSETPRRKRDTHPHQHPHLHNPFLDGAPLRSVSKKDGRNTW